ncbi:hypothetical protein AAVH_36692, partial [Aphelenchoides avenae]
MSENLVRSWGPIVMTSGLTVKSAILRGFTDDTEVNFDAKVVWIKGPFTVRKKDGGEFLKLEAILENCEREAFKLNAFGPQLSFQLHRQLPLNALLRFENVRVTAARFAAFRIGTLTNEFKYTPMTKVTVLKECVSLPELPLSDANDSMKLLILDIGVRITAERMVSGADNEELMGNVLMKETNGDPLRMYCIVKGVPVEQKQLIRSGVDVVATCTVRKDSSGAPSLRIEAWHDLKLVEDGVIDDDVQVLTVAKDRSLTGADIVPSNQVSKGVEGLAFATVSSIEDPEGFNKTVHKVKCSLASPFEPMGSAHVARVFIETDEEFLSAGLRVQNAPVSIERILADTEVVFSGTVCEEEEGLMFSITYDKMAVAGDEGKENASEIFSELEAADVERISERAVGFVVVKVAKRFEKNTDGYVGYATMVDKRSLALKVLLLDNLQNWPTDLAVNSVVRLGGSLEKNNRRFSIIVGSPDDCIVLEEGQDRKSLGGASNAVQRHAGAQVDKQTDESHPEMKNNTSGLLAGPASSVTDDYENSFAGTTGSLLAHEEAKVNAMSEVNVSDSDSCEEQLAVSDKEVDRNVADSITKRTFNLKQEKVSLEGFGEALKTASG